MAVAMIGGLALATVATLLVAPALYALALPRRRRLRLLAGAPASPAPGLPHPAVARGRVWS
jgi:hypothetical protein